MIIIPFGDPNTHGTLANTVVYQRRRGQVMCRKYTRQRDIRSSAQLSQRSWFSNAVAAWHLLSTADKDLWRSNATGMVMTGYNLFIRNYLVYHVVSTTPLMYTKLNDLVINTFRSTSGVGWTYRLYYYPSITLQVQINDNNGLKQFFTPTFPVPSQIFLRFKKVFQDINIPAGDTWQIFFNDTESLTCYLPDIINETLLDLFLADDGSTYYDPALTDLAQAAP